ncbi:hypothetical protein [Asticcacaulis sp.]|uniref:hypothetical protein n=1 Tax=Asticcacaulis sp. TaxID=1872648 RepID=UPI003F7C35CF
MSSMPISERKLMIPALCAASEMPNGFIPTSDLIVRLEDIVHPTGEDNKILAGRHDTKFSQKVRNLVSHRSGSNTMFSLGLAVYIKDAKGIQITDTGRQFIKNVI